jgi:GNAT superfamily N-acetyltransferase
MGSRADNRVRGSGDVPERVARPAQNEQVQKDEGVEIAVIDKSRWPDLEQLFESRGGPKSCWCMVWRDMPERPQRSDGPSRKRALKGRVQAGQQVGLLAYLDGEPTAWCSVAPRPTYKELGGVSYEGTSDADVWSIVCFFVKRAARGKGIFERLLTEAITHARSKGAAVIEGYPVDPDSPSYRFMGFVASFMAMGFEEVGRAGSRRHVISFRTDG